MNTGGRAPSGGIAAQIQNLNSAQRAYNDCLNSTMKVSLQIIRDQFGMTEAPRGQMVLAGQIARAVANATAVAVRNCSQTARTGMGNASATCAGGRCSQRPAQVCVSTTGRMPTLAACNTTFTVGRNTVSCLVRPHPVDLGARRRCTHHDLYHHPRQRSQDRPSPSADDASRPTVLPRRQRHVPR